jgi:hypothetical protein
MTPRPWTRYDQLSMPCTFCGTPTTGRLQYVIPCCRSCWGSPIVGAKRPPKRVDITRFQDEHARYLPPRPERPQGRDAHRASGAQGRTSDRGAG